MSDVRSDGRRDERSDGRSGDVPEVSGSVDIGSVRSDGPVGVRGAVFGQCMGVGGFCKAGWISGRYLQEKTSLCESEF